MNIQSEVINKAVQVLEEMDESLNKQTMYYVIKKILRDHKYVADLAQKVTCVEYLEQIMEEVDIINYGRLITYLVFLCHTRHQERISEKDFCCSIRKMFYVAKRNNISLDPDQYRTF